MKYLILTAMLLSASHAQYITAMDKAKQDVACEKFGGAYSRSNGVLRCNDGTYQKYEKITGPKVAEALKLYTNPKPQCPER